MSTKRIVTDDPKVKAARDALERTRQLLAKAEQDALEARQKTPSDAGMAERAAAIVGGADPMTLPVRPDLAAIHEQVKLLRVAADMAEKQLAQAKDSASQTIVAEAAADQRAAAQRVLRAAEELEQALGNEEALAESLRGRGVRSMHLQRATAPVLRETVSRFVKTLRQTWKELK